MGVLKNLHPSHFVTALLIAAAVPNAAASAAVEPPQQNGEEMLAIFPRVYTKVWNGVQEWSILQAECKSADDDVGFQFLANGTAYSWSFHPNWLGTTLFSCVLKGAHGRVGFKAYNFQRDFRSGRCVTECKWNATANGVHGFNQRTQAYDIFHAWRRH